MEESRRSFIKKTVLASTAVYAGSLGFTAKSYGKIMGANSRVRIGVVGFSDRFRTSLFPAFLDHYKQL